MTARNRHFGPIFGPIVGPILAAVLGLAPLAGCEDDTTPAGSDASAPSNDAGAGGGANASDANRSPDTNAAATDAGAGDRGPADTAGAASGDATSNTDAGAVSGDTGAASGDTRPGTTDTAAAAASPGTGLAVLSTDYKSAAISLVDPATGLVTKDACLSSASKAPQLSAALSGDVALPSRPQIGHPLLVIDRKQSVLTWVDPKDCTVLKQLNVGTGFAANPYDVVSVSASKAYVLRYDANKAKADDGSDLLVIDPEKGTAGAAIDLRAHVGPGPAGKTLLPRPSSGLLFGGKVYVVLEKQDATFGAAGPGRVVILDPATDRVTGTIDLPTLRNCGAIAPLGPTGLVVSCGGAFSDGPKQIDGSGIAWIDLSVTPPAIKKVVEAKAFGRPVSFGSAAVLDESLAFTVTAGEFTGSPKDTLWAYDWKDGTPRKVFESTESFVLSPFLDTAGKRLFVAEALDKMPRVHTFKIDATGATMAAGTFVASPSTGLPPRAFAWY